METVVVAVLAVVFLLALLQFLARGSIGMVTAIRDGYRGIERVCPHCGHSGKPIEEFPVCEQCGRDRREPPT